MTKPVIPVCKVADYMPIGSLSIHPENSELRECTRERLDDLKSSIVSKGFYEPILVWRERDWVISGNHRLKAAEELVSEGYIFGDEADPMELPVVFVDCDEARAKAILFEGNGQYATWVKDKLEEALSEAEKAGVNLKSYGFSQEEVDKLVSTSLKEAEDSVGTAKERTIDPVDSKKLAEAVKEAEYSTLVLEKETHEQMVDILGRLSKEINPAWEPGDSYTLAAGVICQTMNEAMSAGEFMSALKSV